MELTAPYDFIAWGATGSNSRMQKALHSTIFLNQKVRNKQWWCAETTSSFCRGGASRAQKDANISTKSATKPSSGFALKDIKNSIFQLSLNSCVLIKNVIWPVNICRQLHPVLFSTWKWKKRDMICWEQVSYALKMRHVPQPHFKEAEVQPVSCLRMAAVGWDKPTEPTTMWTENCAELVECPTSSSKLSSPAPYAFHTTSGKCLSTGTYHVLFV